ncbi:MAG: acyl-CoA dehydrogenase family protein, partial [Bacteroidota bacterium]
INKILSLNPMSVFIPKHYNGRGGSISEGIDLVAAASYAALPLGLIFGINWGLFLQPLIKYADEEIKNEVLNGFLNDKKLGGLMITEPGHGSDALNMQSSYHIKDNAYHLKGTKHWGGLTGMADYWLLTARKKTPEGSLQRDIDFFISDNHQKDQHVEVEEIFHNLGLYMIPYGRNNINARIPLHQKLNPQTTGISMMLDSLHRNRMLIPAIAMGFTHRILDEAIEHCHERTVGNKQLINYDQVRNRLNKIQHAFTLTSAMCHFANKNAMPENNLLSWGMLCNSMKAISTDLMQESAQHLFQLNGAKAYRLNHFAGRAIVDSRPFQIFEGPNDILYIQTGEALLKGMKTAKETNLHQFLSHHPLTQQASSLLKRMTDFDLNRLMSQRKTALLGKLMSKFLSMNMLLSLGEQSFNPKLISNSIEQLLIDIRHELQTISHRTEVQFVVDYQTNSYWQGSDSNMFS